MNEEAGARMARGSNIDYAEGSLTGVVGARSDRNHQYSSDVLAAQSREDRQIRQTALAQACHDLKGEGDYEEVLKRAKAYFGFLKNG